MNNSSKKIRVCAFPLEDHLEGEYKVCDHINLCGKAIKDIGFIPISDLYADKNNPDAIKVACLKEAVEPSQKEKEALLKLGVQAYSYELIEPVLRAAANNETAEAVVYFPKLPEGFSLSAKACMIKASGDLDLGIISSKTQCLWAGSFTQNKLRAFCVDENLRFTDKKINVIACNSGNANACTGAEGAKKDLEFRSLIAKQTGLSVDKVLLASTGGIGVQLPLDTIKKNILKEGSSSIKSFAQSLLTTDTCIKIAQDSKSNFLGFTKGSGMIHPNMATMLGFIVTNKKIQGLSENEAKSFMQESLLSSVQASFNSITVDGDTSTNDSVFLMNNYQGDEISKEEFQASLDQICSELAFKIVADGEGLTKVSRLELSSDLADKEARELGRFILNSSLVKTALHGNDPNWGRIMASLGQYLDQANIDTDIKKAKLSILDEVVFEKGGATEFNREELIQKMKKQFLVDLKLDLGGSKKVRVFGNDLTADYIKINADYFS